MHYKTPRFAIREVSEMTGIKPVTLRAWQRRYGLIQPKRTEKGHRLFSEKDIDLIREIQGWLNKGVPIGKVKELIKNGAQSSQAQVIDESLHEVEQLLQAIAEMDSGKGDKILSGLFKEYPTQHVVDKVIHPVQEALESVKATQRSLQVSLFQSLLITVSNRIIESENKVAANKKALLVSFDSAGSVDTRIHALLLSDSGNRVTMLEGVEDISGLSEMLDPGKVSQVYFHCSKNIGAKVAGDIKEFVESKFYEVGYSPLIHQVYFSNQEQA
ncbi:hypothetical protein VINI7043_15155 [Vibrio nigripulchritudo ATCC 27043]|uniref:MerR family transcriptional regulator n=1 Tax=Vibrio nigripulchritudo TaxID=28173 RepID=UPI00021C0E57|nr:MerR family transcriptional regulator [Vibrio nigripulchritudo]EGU54663.1 hypothetical protein VINI7043_15155 [Vibrio nigripulchritudo ATCC 27043]CCN33259.1 conserved hypothetical protein carrying Helix-Turn-Helix DNA binding domain [Vibrio nigripulchritudo AM115]CCN42301.1 conserved hypothetical protein carrying Helix-Turn-Helix DNA binding domain [Vibrio nigripulchritudo FTn2]CCN65926.1 conserved hypothetical protein carrying Helix-Turn-Helix DNA binding domain [Vibrio nigripulchritudo POn